MAVPLLAAALACVGTQAAAATAGAPDGVTGSAPVGTSPYASGNLDISMRSQRYDEWCWAASGATVLAYEGERVSQSDFCDGARGLPQGTRCPNRPAELGAIVRGLRAQGASAQAVNGAMSYASVRRNIDSGTPFVTAIAWTAGGGHAEVGYAYDSTNRTMSIGDPWPSDQRYQTYNYRDYVRNSRFRWVGAVANISLQGGVR